MANGFDAIAHLAFHLAVSSASAMARIGYKHAKDRITSDSLVSAHPRIPHPDEPIGYHGHAPTYSYHTCSPDDDGLVISEGVTRPDDTYTEIESYEPTSRRHQKSSGPFQASFNARVSAPDALNELLSQKSMPHVQSAPAILSSGSPVVTGALSTSLKPAVAKSSLARAGKATLSSTVTAFKDNDDELDRLIHAQFTPAKLSAMGIPTPFKDVKQLAAHGNTASRIAYP